MKKYEVTLSKNSNENWILETLAENLKKALRNQDYLCRKTGREVTSIKEVKNDGKLGGFIIEEKEEI